MNIRQKCRMHRILWLAVFLILAGSFPAAAKQAKHYTPKQAAAWISSKAGKTITFWNPPSNAQCTELVYLYYRHLGVDGPTEDAAEYAYLKPPAKWKRIPYYKGFTAQPGDIAVWTGGQHGHVAVITEADSNTFRAIEQNAGGRHYASFFEHSYGREGSLTFWGVIRPNFKGRVKDPHETGSGRSTRSCIYYYKGGRKTLIILHCNVWYYGAKRGGSFVVCYGEQQLASSEYRVSYQLNANKTMTCTLRGVGAYQGCRGKITVPLS